MWQCHSVHDRHMQSADVIPKRLSFRFRPSRTRISLVGFRHSNPVAAFLGDGELAYVCVFTLAQLSWVSRK